MAAAFIYFFWLAFMFEHIGVRGVSSFLKMGGSWMGKVKWQITQ